MYINWVRKSKRGRKCPVYRSLTQVSSTVRDRKCEEACSDFTTNTVGNCSSSAVMLTQP